MKKKKMAASTVEGRWIFQQMAIALVQAKGRYHEDDWLEDAEKLTSKLLNAMDEYAEKESCK
jgi:hypothetical protein